MSVLFFFSFFFYAHSARTIATVVPRARPLAGWACATVMTGFSGAKQASFTALASATWLPVEQEGLVEALVLSVFLPPDTRPDVLPAAMLPVARVYSQGL